jgi:putative transposase
MPRTGRPMKPLELSDGARAELESLARSRSLPSGLVRRARAVLLCADGLSNGAVADEVGLTRQTVGKWRERFRTQGLMGLYEERRPGKPRSIED